MGLNSLVRSKGFKNFMAKLYGWGASLVILGALFKIMHYPGAGIMLLIGMGTEAIIFFFSAFEPPHVEPDWSLVYPELAGMYHDSNDEAETKAVARRGGASASNELDRMLEDANITPELIENLGNGMRHLGDNAAKMSDLTDASVVTDEYLDKMKDASSSAGKFAETIGKDASASEEYVEKMGMVANSAVELSNAYTSTAQAINKDLEATDDYVSGIKAATESANALAEKYRTSAESLTKSAEAIDFSHIDASAYGEQLQRIAKNLDSLNAMYETQLQSAAGTERMNEGIENFIANLNQSVENTAKYRDAAGDLTKNLEALNGVYGNILNAMTIKQG